MEAGESGLDGDVVEESKSNDARVQEVDGNSISEGDDTINGENNAILEAVPSRRSSSSSSSSSNSSKASSKDLIEVVTGDESLELDPPSELKGDGNEEHKDESLMGVPTIQTMDRAEGYNPNRIPESVFAVCDPHTPTEWSSASNESLFSIHPQSFSYIGDQSFFLAEEMHKANELNESKDITAPNDLPQASVESVDDKKETKPIIQDEAKPPYPAVLHPNASVRSDGSVGSESFAFPILAGSSSTKTDILNSRRRNSRGHNLEGETSNTRQPTPSPSPSPWKKALCCFCFSCLPCCTFFSSHSCCARQSCFSSCAFPSCFSSLKSCCTCPSLRSRPFCARCKGCSCLSCWPCR